jgi:hypothetical protein
MDARSLQVVHRVLVVQSALLIGVVTVLARALLMMSRVDVGPGAVLGEVLLMLGMEALALAFMLGVHGVVRRGVPGMQFFERTVRSAVALVLFAAEMARAAFAASWLFPSIAGLLVVGCVLVAHLSLGLFLLVDLASRFGSFFHNHSP